MSEILLAGLLANGALFVLFICSFVWFNSQGPGGGSGALGAFLLMVFSFAAVFWFGNMAWAAIAQQWWVVGGMGVATLVFLAYWLGGGFAR